LGGRFPSTLSFHTRGKRKKSRSPTSPANRVFGRRKDGPRLTRPARWPRKTATNTPGLTLVASTNPAAPNSPRLSTLCFDGTSVPSYVTPFCLTCPPAPQGALAQLWGCVTADGLLEAGLCRNSSHRDTFNSSIKIGFHMATRTP